MYSWPRLASTFASAVLLAIVLAPRTAAESPALLVGDLVPPRLPSGASFPTPGAQLGGIAFFTAEDTLHGRELWRTGGTPETTRLVADLCPGSCAGFPAVAVVGDKLFVIANDGSGSGLYVSDGTGVGTHLIHRFLEPSSLSGAIVTFDDRAWFVILEGQPYRYELWQSDGTAAGTARWTVDCGQSCQVVSPFLAAAGDELFFGVNVPPAFDYRLWRTDGTAAGTRPAETHCPPACVDLFSPIGVAGGHYYFTGSDAAHGTEIWVAGGDLPAPRLVADLSPGTDSTDSLFGFAFANAAWFRVQAGTARDRWYRLTPDGATVATEVEPSGPEKAAFSVWPAGDRLYFVVAEQPPAVSLWTVRPGVEPARLLVSGLQSAGRVGEVDGLALISIYRPGDLRARLLASDGTVAGTRELAGLSPSLRSTQLSLSIGGGILIAADDGIHGIEPWMSDGTSAGTRALGDLQQTWVTSPRELTASGEDVAFVIDGGVGDHTLYAAGASAGSPPAARPLMTGGHVSELATSGDKLFAAYLPPTGGGTWQLSTVDSATGPAPPAFNGEMPFQLTPWRGGVAFGEYRDGEPLWWTDGTAAGTHKLLDLAPGWSPFCPILCPHVALFPTEMTPIGDRLYFVATSNDGDNLWTSDGTTPGTLPLVNSAPNVVPIVGEVTPFQGGVAFVRYGEATEIWTSHGAVESTRAVVTVSGTPQLLGAVGNRLVYSVYANGLDTLWATDGTAAGTALLHDLGGAVLRPRVQSLRFQGFDSTAQAVVRERVFFVVADDAAGEELWVSDGTAAGTRRVADVRPGTQGSHPRALTAYRGCALFAATDGVTGYEPWASDGQTAWRVADVAPGEAASTPAEITPAGGFVYFTADDGVHGREVFAVATTELDARCAVQPPVNPGPPPGSLTSPAAPGFAFLVKIGPAATATTGVPAPCVNGTVCVTGTAAGRGDVFIRMVATSAGHFAPAIVKLTPDEVEVTVYQLATGVQKVYRLAATVPPSDVLTGVLGRDAFVAATAASATLEPSATFEPMTFLNEAAARLEAGAPTRAGGGARWFSPRDIRGYRFKAWLVDANGNRQAVRAEGCLEGTLCFSGPMRGRSDVLVRLLDRRPAAARLTGTGLELWVERTKTGELRKYLLAAEGPASTSLNGVLDAVGFRR